MLRIIMMGLLVGSALGALAGTAASVYVVQKSQVSQLYRDQVSISSTRAWEI